MHGLSCAIALTDVQTQANNLINGKDVQTWINTDFSATTPFIASPAATWDDLVRTPSF